MPSELVFYTNPMSRGRVVRWMLEEAGCAYRCEVMGYGPAMKSAEYLRINPMGKVPAIQHGDVVVTETPAICAYLADAFPAADLAPVLSDPARGAYYRWLFFAAGPLEAAVTNQALGIVIPPEKKGFVGYGSYDEVLNALDALLTAQEYAAGGRFSAADVYLGSALDFGMTFGTIAARSSFVRYITQLKARPAAVRARAMDDALLPPPAS